MIDRERMAEKKAALQAPNVTKVAVMPAPCRTIGERLHAVILRSRPALQPALWCDMPAYPKDGKTACSFRLDKKYMTFCFTRNAVLSRQEGAPHQLIQSAWYFIAADDVTEARLSALVAMSAG